MIFDFRDGSDGDGHIVRKVGVRASTSSLGDGRWNRICGPLQLLGEGGLSPGNT